MSLMGAETSMRKFLLLLRHFAVGFFAIDVFSGMLLASAGAHEAHRMKCTQARIDAVRADIQVMKNGEAKSAAAKETETAADMLARNDLDGCVIHLHKAIEAIEK